MHFTDEEGHKAFVNTLALVNAGIMTAEGTVLKREIRGGEIVFSADGTSTGYLKEQARTYTRSFLDNDKLFSVDLAFVIFKFLLILINRLIDFDLFALILTGRGLKI